MHSLVVVVVLLTKQKPQNSKKNVPRLPPYLSISPSDLLGLLLTWPGCVPGFPCSMFIRNLSPRLPLLACLLLTLSHLLSLLCPDLRRESGERHRWLREEELQLCVLSLHSDSSSQLTLHRSSKPSHS
jgi:hypothetical protein